MTKRVRMSKEERRKQIIDAALSVFVEKGYNGTTTIDIANKAEIAEVTLFRHFETKEILFKEAIESLILDTFENTIRVSSDLKALDKFKFVLKDRLLFVQKNKDVIKLLLSERRINPDITSYDFIHEITQLIDKSIKQSNLEIKDISFLIRLVRGSMLSFLYDVKNEENEIENYTNQFVDMLINSNLIKEKEGNIE